MRVRYSFSSRHTRTLKAGNAHKHGFPKIVRELIERSDIILQVLDARFIQETRNKEMEELVQSKNKKLVYIINKADLVDISGVKKEIETLGILPFVIVSTKDRKGSSELRDRIKIEVSRLKLTRRANVGIVGMPNTGKSSIINLLTGKASARTATEAGFTKGIQKIKLSDDISVIDTPGVIPDLRYSMQDPGKMAEHSRLGTRSYDRVKEPELAVHDLVRKYPQAIERHYNLDAGGNSEVLIEELGKKKKFLLKGNRVDIDRTARFIIREWQEGKIKI